MRLVSTNGPLAGTSLTLTDGVSIGGTDPGAAGRPCCRILATDAGGFTLQALDRQTPVFVNGLPVTTRTLQPGDEVGLADSLFVVRSDEDAPATRLAPCDVTIGSASQGRRLFEVGFDASVLHGPSRTSPREGRDLDALLRVGAALSSVHGLAGLDAALAGLFLEILPAERIVLTGSEDGVSVVRSAWTSGRARHEPVVVDPALLERIAKERVAVVIPLDTRQAVVAPMMAFGRAVGCVWMESRPGEPIDEGHVRLLLVVAALAAVAQERTREAARLQQTNELLQAEINLDHNMVGRSRLMRKLYDRIARVAATDATALLRGESGTGKELVARALHRNSRRADRPFIAINCAALTESLLESELFGHEKGAFTGAIGLKKGKLELAHGGTLFLDEIGELPLALQAKLLRAIQEREFERVGGTQAVRVDFRLIAATNRDLEAAVKAGTFRQDLFYRLNVVSLALPALRERKEDLPQLAEYFVRKHAPRCGRRVQGVTPGALAQLSKHDWPGNVRELENVIEQALVLGSGDRITAEDLPPGLGDAVLSSSATLDYHDTVARTKRQLILRAFEQSGQSHAAAARLLGVHPNYLHRLMRNFKLRKEWRVEP